MFDFFGGKRVPTIGSGKGVKAPSIASRKEVHLVFLGLLAIVAVALWQIQGRSGRMGAGGVSPERAPAAMRAPQLSALPALPGPAAIAEQQGTIADLQRDGVQPSLLTGLDAIVMAWVEALEAADRAKPPLPQRVSAEDFGRRLVQGGQPLLVSGRLDDLSPAVVEGGGGGWRWLSVALAEGNYALVLARDDGGELVLNERIDVVGRYLGRLETASAGTTQETPLIAARVVTAARSATANAIPEGMREFYGPLRLPEDLYRDVNDELPLIETRAYYYTVGQVKTEGATPELYADAIDANRQANDIHQRPDEFRGRVGTINGSVYHVWEDEQVAADKPFDVRRVGRILLFKRDIGPITEDGVTKTKSVLRLFELAVVGDQPLPAVGDYIEATGRFVKWRSIKVDRNRPEDRVNNFAGGAGKVYSMFFVVPSFRQKVVESIDWMPVKITLSVFAGVFFVAMLFYLHRDRGAERRMRDSVALLRETRRKAGAHRRPPAPAAGGEASEPPPPDSPQP